MVSATWKKTQAYFVSWEGIRNVMEVLNQDDSSVDSWWDEWSTTLMQGEVKDGSRTIGDWEVKIIYDEERFVDINNVDDTVLYRIFYFIDPVLYYSLLDWKDADQIPRIDGTGQVVGAEDEYYASLGFNYECRDGPLESLFELGMIRSDVELIQTFGPSSFFNTSKNDAAQKVNRILSFLRIPNKIAYAHSGGHTHHGNPPIPPPPPPPPLPPPPPPSPNPDWPDFEPTPPGVVGPGRSVTVYGGGRLNINTAGTGALLAMGLVEEAVKRVYWFKCAGNVFQNGSASGIIQDLINAGWLIPEEVAYDEVTNSINEVAGRLKVNSSYFFVYIESGASKARHFVSAVIERYKDADNRNRCKIVSWWEWTLTPT